MQNGIVVCIHVEIKLNTKHSGWEQVHTITSEPQDKPRNIYITKNLYKIPPFGATVGLHVCATPTREYFSVPLRAKYIEISPLNKVGFLWRVRVCG